MEKMVYSLTFKIPCDYLLALQARKKLRKSMNINDFSNAEKINLKKLSEIWKNSRKAEKTQEFKIKTQRSRRLLNITPKTLKKRAWVTQFKSVEKRPHTRNFFELTAMLTYIDPTCCVCQPQESVPSFDQPAAEKISWRILRRSWE